EESVDGDEYLPRVTRKKERFLKTLTLQEAIMKLTLSDDQFFLYKSEEDCSLKVLYRRRDGSYGLISPE
ncbi:MAG: sigma 54 modulation/S30EA ribosomal C-terminal domain-containing protein, partial [Chlamydiota bacterium]|nr:sigma 54 modulation/S30EA ribosomal C-terminal domain-containing protein [Chlamydiota bacterium]